MTITNMAALSVVLGAIGGLARIIWNAGNKVRENMVATEENTAAIEKLLKWDSRLSALEDAVFKRRR